MSGTYKNIQMQVLGESGYDEIYPIVTTVLEQNKNLQQKFWRGTQAEYNAITTKDANTMYIILDGAGEPIQSGDMLKSVYDPTGKEQDIFAYALPASEKGVASGVATLDTNGKVPSTQLPDMDYIPTSEKGANSGVATLDSNGKVLSTQLPDMDYIPTSEKGANSGVATLGSDGKVPTSQLPDMDYAPSTHASQHATGGSDPITPASIGAATSNHTHSNYAASSHNHSASNITSGTLSANRIPTLAASKVTSGTFAATDVKAATGTDYTTARIRNIKASTTDLTAGSSTLANGDIYLVYE